MELAPAGVRLSFEVTFDSPSLPVAMTVYDDSGSVPVLVQGPTAMAWVAGNTYRGKFTPLDGKSYIIIKAVYTNGGFTTMSPDYAQGSESIIAQLLGTPPPAGVVGYVESNDAVTGVVVC